MKAFINQRFLKQTRFDSAAPSGSAVVAYELQKGGSYEIAVARDDRLLARVPFGVVPGRETGDPSAARPHCAPAPGLQGSLSVDLAKLAGASAAPALPSLASAGWVSFTSSQPLLDHHVLVRRVENGEAQDEFDSRRLDARSVFGLTLIRPGRYSLANTIDGAQAEIVVDYPKVGKTPYRPPEPLEVTVTDQGFGERSFRLSPAQGMVFRFRVEGRIQIELVEPDDGRP